jgi:hypothetical protein
MAQTSRTNGKGRSCPRSANGAHETGRRPAAITASLPSAVHSICWRRCRARSCAAGGAGCAAHCTRTAGSACSARWARGFAIRMRRAMWRLGTGWGAGVPRWNRGARRNRHAVPRRPGQGQRREHLLRTRDGLKRTIAIYQTDPLMALQRGRQAPPAARVPAGCCRPCAGGGRQVFAQRLSFPRRPAPTQPGSPPTCSAFAPAAT